MTAQSLLNFLEKAGVVIVLTSDGDAVVSSRSSRQLTAKEQELFTSLREDIIAILKSRKTSTKVGTDVKTIYGPSGPSTLRGAETFVNSFNGQTGAVTAIVGVSSVNGQTGGITFYAGTNVTITSSTGGITIDSSGGGGSTSGVSSFAGFTGDVAAGVATNEILYHDGSSINGSGDFTFDGTDVVLGGQGHFEGFFDGPLQKDIKADEALAAGDPVYITGNVGSSNRVTVAKSDASDPLKMPAAGIVSSAFSTNQEGVMTLVGAIKSFDTSGYTANNELYVSPGGGLTASRPTGSSHLVQKIVRVGRVHASTGTIMVHGAGRANDVPNLVHARAGISSDAGITFPDGTHQNTADTGATAYGVGDGLSLDAAGQIFSIDPDAVIHIAGASIDGGITASGDVALDTRITFSNAGFISNSGTRDNQIVMTDASSGSIRLKPDGNDKFAVYGFPGLVKSFTDFLVNGESTLVGKVTTQAGISMDTAGITFPNASHQTVAWDPSSAISLTGGDTSTPSLTITSDDNGTSAAPIIDLIRDPADDGNGANGDYLGQIKFKGQSDSGTERVYAKITGKIGSATNSDEDGIVEHMVQRDGSAQIVFRTTKSGIKLNADGGTPMELEFSDGTSINTAPTDRLTEYVAGFNFDGQGTSIGAGSYTDFMRPMERDCEAYMISVRSPTAIPAGKLVRVIIKKVDKSYINSNDATIQLNSSNVGSLIELSAGEIGTTLGIGASLDAGDFVYPQLIEGSAGSLQDKLQVFVNYRG